jgi:signal transduction histidine kinase
MPPSSTLPNLARVAPTGEFLAAAAHELKNPMEAMGNLLYLLRQNSSLDEQAFKHLALLEQELDRMRVVVAQTLGIFRKSVRAEPVQISDLLDAVVSFYAHKIRHKRLTVHKRYTCSGVVQAVPSELRQVFTNLVINALEAAPVGGKLVLRISPWKEFAHPARRGVRVTIADNGPGIAPQYRRRIFEPFFTTKGDKGNGLGLWVSRGIVSKYGGLVRFRTNVRPGRSGTAFSVFLPDELRKGKVA